MPVLLPESVHRQIGGRRKTPLMKNKGMYYTRQDYTVSFDGTEYDFC